jgi:hypothetical protein
MSTIASEFGHVHHYPVQIDVETAIEHRNRLTTAFRIILAIPHVILVGGPIAAALSWMSNSPGETNYDWSAAGGVMGIVAAACAMIAWFAIVFTGKHPEGLWTLAAFYLRWRVRAVAYAALLRDEYPPFGEGAYPAELHISQPVAARDRVGVAFRILLAIPHVLIVWALSLAWAVTTMVAWFAILFTGRYPPSLYHFGVNVLRWNIRVEAYLLLLRDEYPPFSFEAR